MNERNRLFAFLYTIGTALFVLATLFLYRNPTRAVNSAEVEYEISLNADNQPSIANDGSILRSRYTDFQYSDIEMSEGGHVKLLENGLITNVTAIRGINYIKVLFTASPGSSLMVYYGEAALPITHETQISSNVVFYSISGYRYFLLQAKHGEIDIEAIEIKYSCSGEDGDPILPIVYLTTELDTYGNHKPINSRVNYTNAALHIEDAENAMYSISESKALNCEVKIRGNSTAEKPKKPYRIKLSKKTSLFGYDKAKNYVLLAEYMDGSALHNFSAFSYASMLPGFRYTPTPKHVEVYLNGVYNGLYVFAEHTEAKEGRLDLEMDITADMSPEDINIMFELDHSASQDATETIDVTYFAYEYSESITLYYTLKYPEMDECASEEQYFEVFNYLKTYVDDMWSVFKTGSAVEFATSVDEDSLKAYALVDFVFREMDHARKSFKMFRLASDSKLHFGSIWDYDSVSFSLPYLGNPVQNPFSESYSNPYFSTAFYNYYFQFYASRFSGLAAIKDLYNNNGSDALGVIESLVYDQTSYISQNLIANANLWFNGNLRMVFENLKYTNTYIHERKLFLDSYFA